jgi:hypothetical protein
VEACTVTTPDAITAFAVPNPNCSSQNQSAFSGPAAARVTSFSESLSLLRISNCLFLLTLSTVDSVEVNMAYTKVNARSWCNHKLFVVDLWKSNVLQKLDLRAAGKFHPRYSQSFHSHKRQHAPIVNQPTVLTRASS